MPDETKPDRTKPEGQVPPKSEEPVAPVAPAEPKATPPPSKVAAPAPPAEAKPEVGAPGTPGGKESGTPVPPPDARPPASHLTPIDSQKAPADAAPSAPPAAKPPAAAPPASAPPAAKPPAAAAPPAAKPAAPAPPPKAPIPTPQPWDSETVQRMKAKFGASILNAQSYLGQNYFIVEAVDIEAICTYLRDSEQFNMLADLTAVDYPKNPKRFEVIYQLYSFPRNERLRVKAAVADNESISTVVPIWIAANWLEREVYDMFGVTFAGHPDLRRILLPEEWQGFPLRKDHHILQQDDQWVRENLHIESGQ